MLLFSENAFVAERLVKSECPKAVVWLLVDQRQYELTKLRHNFTIGTNCPGYHLTCIRHKAPLLNAPVIWRIAAADERLNRICQVVPMCPAIWAHWRYLANMIEVVA